MTTEEVRPLAADEKACLIATHCQQPELAESLMDSERNLNAMNVAERMLTVKQCVIYAARLRGYAVESTSWDAAAPAFEFHATAVQRIDAFLRTIDEPASQQNNQIQRTPLAKTDDENH